MGDDVLTTWGVVLDVDGIVDGQPSSSASDWFADGRVAFFDRCSRLVAFLGSEDAELRTSAEQIGPVDVASCADGARIGVSVVEVRPTSFTMAIRIRPSGDAAGAPTNGRCTVVVERRTTAERLPIPREVRDEFIAIQLAARELC